MRTVISPINLAMNTNFGFEKPKHNQPPESSKSFSYGKIPANLNPDYFHPSFKSASPQKIEQLSNFLDTIIAGTEKFSKESLAKMAVLIKETVEATLKSDIHIINWGKEGVVHRLNEKYVFKILNGEDCDMREFRVITHTGDENLKTWYGGAIVSSKNVSIMRNADPQGIQIPIGAPYDYYYTDARAYYKNNKCLSRVAKIPQKSFDEIAKDLKELDKGSFYGHNRKFDFDNPNNFLLIDDKIRVVDDLEYRENKPNTINDMLTAFILKLNAITSAHFDEKLIAERRNVFKKCVIACEKSELPLNGMENDRINEVLHFTNFKTKEKDFVSSLCDIRKKFPNMDERINAVSAFLEALI